MIHLVPDNNMWEASFRQIQRSFPICTRPEEYMTSQRSSTPAKKDRIYEPSGMRVGNEFLSSIFRFPVPNKHCYITKQDSNDQLGDCRLIQQLQSPAHPLYSRPATQDVRVFSSLKTSTNVFLRTDGFERVSYPAPSTWSGEICLAAYFLRVKLNTR